MARPQLRFSLPLRTKALLAGCAAAGAVVLAMGGLSRWGEAKDLSVRLVQAERAVMQRQDELQALQRWIGTRGGKAEPMELVLPRALARIQKAATLAGVQISSLGIQGAHSGQGAFKPAQMAKASPYFPGLKEIQINLNGEWHELAGMNEFARSLDDMPAAFTQWHIDGENFRAQVVVYGK